MKCPVCIEPELAIAERQGIEIDYCPTCRGVWLDRGELDKIIERTTLAENQTPDATADEFRGQSRQTGSDRSRRDRDDDADYSAKKRYRRKNLLAELFDFD